MSQTATMEQVISDLIAATRVVRKKASGCSKPKNPFISCFLSFSEEETSRMSPLFSPSFRKHGNFAFLTKERRKNGSFLYTIKYMRNGYSITVKNSDLRKAKKKFISKTWREMKHATVDKEMYQ